MACDEQRELNGHATVLEGAGNTQQTNVGLRDADVIRENPYRATAARSLSVTA